MSSQSELKLPWPEIKLHFVGAEIPKENKASHASVSEEALDKTKLPELWNAFLHTFSGKYSRFANYLMYLSTDFSGGFKVCSVLAPNSPQNPFSVPFSSPGPALDIGIRDTIWKLSKDKRWEEQDRDEWELLGYSFLLTGNIIDFKDWVQFTKSEFGLSEDCKRFLYLLKFGSDIPVSEKSLLQMLVEYSEGHIQNVDFKLISDAVMKDGYWQLAGVLIDAIGKANWMGENILPFLDFLSGFYNDWKDWEKAKFLNITLGKVPAYPALKKASKILNKNQFQEYSKHLKYLFRGDFEESERGFGYESNVPIDPFMITLLRFDKEREIYTNELQNQIHLAPYSYILNLRMAIVYFRIGDYHRFMEFYEKGGRLKFLPIPLYLFAKVKESRKEETLANSILIALEKHGRTPNFPVELGEI